MATRQCTRDSGTAASRYRYTDRPLPKLTEVASGRPASTGCCRRVGCCSSSSSTHCDLRSRHLNSTSHQTSRCHTGRCLWRGPASLFCCSTCYRWWRYTAPREQHARQMQPEWGPRHPLGHPTPTQGACKRQRPHEQWLAAASAAHQY
jgi:hypothetical protein